MLKRPHVDEFLQRMGQLFECVLFTASLAKVSLAPSPELSAPNSLSAPTPCLSNSPLLRWRKLFLWRHIPTPDGMDAGHVRSASLKGFWVTMVTGSAWNRCSMKLKLLDAAT